MKKSETVKNVTMLCEKESIFEYFQKFCWHLKDEYKLDDCGIEKNSSLHLLVKFSKIIKLFVSIASRGIYPRYKIASDSDIC